MEFSVEFLRIIFKGLHLGEQLLERICSLLILICAARLVPAIKRGFRSNFLVKYHVSTELPKIANISKNNRMSCMFFTLFSVVRMISCYKINNKYRHFAENMQK